MTEINKLTKREREVIQLLQQGKSNKLIASSLSVSNSTIEFHLKNIYTKYQVNSRMELILKLGNTEGRDETGKLGNSTVDRLGETAENGAMFNRWLDWASTLRDTISKIGKELFLNEQSHTHPDSTNKSTLDGENSITFQESIRVCLTKYAEFKGRASRSEFWWFLLFVTLVTGALTYLSENLGSVFLVAVLLPLLAAGTRRLNDSGKSPWWQLFLLAPIGGIILLGFMWALPPESHQSEDTLPA